MVLLLLPGEARRNKTGPSTHKSLEPSRSAPTATSNYIERLHFSESRRYRYLQRGMGSGTCPRDENPARGTPLAAPVPGRRHVASAGHPLSPYRLRSLKWRRCFAFPNLSERQAHSHPYYQLSLARCFRWLSRRPPPSSRRRSPCGRR
jgi:hypothetical protein